MSNQNVRDTRFRARVIAWATRLKVKPVEIRLQPMVYKWASCSARGRVTFSRDLLGQPQGFQDFVIVHELLHLRVHNHGKLFRSLLKAHLDSSRILLLQQYSNGL